MGLKSLGDFKVASNFGQISTENHEFTVFPTCISYSKDIINPPPSSNINWDITRVYKNQVWKNVPKKMATASLDFELKHKLLGQKPKCLILTPKFESKDILLSWCHEHPFIFLRLNNHTQEFKILWKNPEIAKGTTIFIFPMRF